MMKKVNWCENIWKWGHKLMNNDWCKMIKICWYDDNNDMMWDMIQRWCKMIWCDNEEIMVWNNNEWLKWCYSDIIWYDVEWWYNDGMKWWKWLWYDIIWCTEVIKCDIM